jgi:hypothetical protein
MGLIFLQIILQKTTNEFVEIFFENENSWEFLLNEEKKNIFHDKHNIDKKFIKILSYMLCEESNRKDCDYLIKTIEINQKIE